jgi:hypothetical protein
VQAKGARIVHQCEGGRQLLARREKACGQPLSETRRQATSAPIRRASSVPALLGQNVFARRCIPTLSQHAALALARTRRAAPPMQFTHWCGV